MKEPCRRCPEWEPACRFSPHHQPVADAIDAAQQTRDTGNPKPLVFRNPRVLLPS